jgi:hypothetical protein
VCATTLEQLHAMEVSPPIRHLKADVLRNDFDESKVALLAQAWKLAQSEAKSLGWLGPTKMRRRLLAGGSAFTAFT